MVTNNTINFKALGNHRAFLFVVLYGLQSLMHRDSVLFNAKFIDHENNFTFNCTDTCRCNFI